ASGAVARCRYQPGASTPAPYPDRRASNAEVHGTQVAATFSFGNPLSRALSAEAGGNVSGRSAGACHAPQTTAIRPAPPVIVPRIALRMAASRRSLYASGCAGIGAAPEPALLPNRRP